MNKVKTLELNNATLKKSPVKDNNLTKNLKIEDVEALYKSPLIKLFYRVYDIMNNYWPEHKVQKSSLISIKTGGCTEDCKYCAQSVHYSTDITVHPYLSIEEVLAKAKEAKENGAQRICLSAAQREVKNNKDFEKILIMIKEIKNLGLETCCTLGMLTDEQAFKLKKAGLDYYNHNIDTSPSFYPKIITTRKFEDRVKTINAVRKAGIHVCCGIIIGMGETIRDRAEALHFLASLNPPPESVPINALIPIKGTPLENRPFPDTIEIIRTIATARILMPESYIRISAGRHFMSKEAQILCFLAGANSLFLGDKLLTAPNSPLSADIILLNELFGK